jgi:hypothetical protein
MQFSASDGDVVVEGVTIARASNTALYFFNVNGSPTIRDCRITDCMIFGDGSAVNVRHGSPVFERCMFDGNVSTRDGGAIYIGSDPDTVPVFVDCAIIDNTAGTGGGVHVSTGSYREGPTILRCLFSGNIAWESGGAVHQKPRIDIVIGDCVFRDNLAKVGGGVYIEDVAASIWNCVFEQNTAGMDGAGLYVDAGDPDPIEITNCTFVANFAVERGGGLFITGSRGTPRVANCVFRLNGADDGWEMAMDRCEVTVAHSNVEGGHAGVYVGPFASLIWGEGNIDADPRFAAAFDGDYRLQRRSPCIDAADNNALPPDVPADLDGNPRFVDDPETANTGVPGNGHVEVADMGAYEYQPPPCAACDANCDSAVDAFDIEPFIALLVGPSPTPCAPCAGDANGDGVVDAFDIEPFVNCIAGP